MTQRLRLWGDFNNGLEVWVLRYNGQLIEELEAELGLKDDMLVTVWDDGDGPDLMERDGYLSLNTGFCRWVAVCDDSTFRRIPARLATEPSPH